MTLNELDVLKQKADLLGITYKSNIGIEALKAKINAKLNDEPDPEAGAENQEGDQQQNPVVERQKTKQEIEQETRERMQRDETAMVRVRISCLNPAKRELKGEIVTVANRYLGTIKKFVPFGEATDNGYHLPRCIFNELRARQFNSVTTKKGPNGQLLPIQRLVPEFAIEELPALTAEELQRLAAAQAAAAGLD